nr:hypothetical protein [Jeotgalibacillus malaysiensis]
MNWEEIKKRHESLKMKTHAEEMALESLKEQKSKQEMELFKVQRENYNKKVVKELLEKSSDEARKNGKEVLEKTATNSVQMVLGDKYSVQIKLDSQRGVPTADVDIVKDTSKGKMVIEAMEEGGGIRDILSLSTFVSNGMLVGEDNKSPNFFDEPTKFVSAEHKPAVANFMKELVDYTEKQTMLVTHDLEYLPSVGDTVYLVEIEDGVSKMTKQ